MKKNILYFISVLMASTAIVAVSVGHADSQPATKLPTVVTPSDSSVKEKLTDGSFVEKAALSSLKDTELSKLALEKSQNKKLKKFAQKVVDGSSSTMKQLQEVASSYRLEVPQQLKPDQREMVNQMRQLTGSAFDEAYADVIKKAQDTTVGLYDNAAGQNTLNAELRVFANKQLPQLRQNQKLAHALSQNQSAATNKATSATDKPTSTTSKNRVTSAQ